MAINEEELLRESYYREIEILQKIKEELNIYIALVIAMGGILAYDISNLWHSPIIDSSLQIKLITIILIIFVINIYLVILIGKMEDVATIGNTQDIQNMFKRISVYYGRIYSRFNRKKKARLINRKKNEILIQAYVDCSKINQDIIYRQKKRISWFINFFCISLIIISIIGIFCIFIDKPMDTNITNWQDVLQIFEK